MSQRLINDFGEADLGASYHSEVGRDFPGAADPATCRGSRLFFGCWLCHVGSWAMSRWSEIGPVAIVHRCGRVSELETKSMPEIADVTATTLLGTMTLREMMEDPRSRMKAIAVFHKGKLVFEEYIGIRDWDNHIWASATKIIVGTLVHMMAGDGLINLDDFVPQYLPELKGTAWDDVTVADVLHQRSGLDISEARLGSTPDHPVTLFYAQLSGNIVFTISRA